MKKLRECIRSFKNYIFDSSIDVKDRAFIVFSVTVLIALFLAIPCGIIMREPISATLSTLIGAVLFSGYVAFCFIKKRMKRARIVISVVLIFVFLPAMFFTNGGAGGGASVWLLLGTIYIVLILDRKHKTVMLILDMIVMTITWTAAYLNPDIVTEYSRGGNYFDTIAALFIVSGILIALFSFQINLFRKEEANISMRRLFEQTAIALTNAIDAKDRYTHGHSSRVAEYSRKIAELSGMSEGECTDVYYTALLHDVGKIGISAEIINKNGKLTDDEYAQIKLHPKFGERILHSINEYPNLSIGAYYHHERYDGKGYPAGLKGEDIPEIARIISVADAYDAMTSKRSYRDPIPQQMVREEIVKGSGTQFDPKYAKIMQHLIDLDTEYEMKERDGITELAGKDELLSERFGDNISEGIHITSEIKTISLKVEKLKSGDMDARPALILFDSLDARYHDDPGEIKKLCYFEYARVWYDGRNECTGARKISVHRYKNNDFKGTKETGVMPYTIEAVRFKDHLQIKIHDAENIIRLIIALPDSTRYSYIGLTGENCRLFDVSISTSDSKIEKGYIPRIAEEISYINVPAGDIPNIQVDSYRSEHTEGIPLKDGMRIDFHTMSLPSARLVWHCPFIDIFYSDNKKPVGPTYREYALIRFDGESWDDSDNAENKLITNLGDDFPGWDEWRAYNKKGYDCSVTFNIKGNTIITKTNNLGLDIRNTTTIYDGNMQIYVSLTGDQCALTNIRITNG